jgi:hypothetical protein
MAETAHELLERIRNENLNAFWKRTATLKPQSTPSSLRTIHLFWQIRLACDGEGASQNLGVFPGLATAEGDGVDTGKDEAIALRVDLAK